jgi:hypothetical protein
MTFAIPVKLKWIEAKDQWHMVTLPNEHLLQELYNCENIARMFPGLEKEKDNQYLIKITRVER